MLKIYINRTQILHEHTMVECLITDCVCDIDYITHKTSRENITMNKYNLINSCGSVSPAINEGKEVGLLHYNIQKNAILSYYPEIKHQSLIT
jgi:hypothetical protein